MPNSKSVVHIILVDFNFGWRVTILGIVADHPGYFTWFYFCELSLGAKFQVCSSLPSGMVGVQPKDGG